MYCDLHISYFSKQKHTKKYIKQIKIKIFFIQQYKLKFFMPMKLSEEIFRLSQRRCSPVSTLGDVFAQPIKSIEYVKNEG